MTPDDDAPEWGPNSPPAPTDSAEVETTPLTSSLDDDDVLTISDDMIHRERIDLEAGMNAFPPATILIILACIAVFGRQLQIGSLDSVQRLVETGAMQREAVLDGEFWRLISAAFMHASPDHLIGNMLMLFILGMACEHAFGWRSFLFLYTACCATGFSLAMTTPLPTVGASGAIFGLGGAVIGLALAHRSKIEVRDHRVGIALAIWSIYTLGLGLLSPMVSNSCHLGGLLGGLALGAVLPPAVLVDRREQARSTSSRVQMTAALAVLLSTSFSFLPRLH
ncbi:rhomboid family intramembrane serine protease [Paludisphaera mucosa]|uniref:Rhomboid family intramembrane serine protease n=1 Tax=Paludisphaera mucosa TaxID=3030827 RepID=A0ABT6F5W4_9BACT|nr:rhomboid family intramembrane serine protease [Paludisphaera mucosa]MDG3002891.1 rhomboid family intramembrane serine protease [Paludisphaera mucosa]